MSDEIEINGKTYKKGDKVDYTKADGSDVITCEVVQPMSDPEGVQLLYIQSNGKKTTFFVRTNNYHRIKEHEEKNEESETTEEPENNYEDIGEGTTIPGRNIGQGLRKTARGTKNLGRGILRGGKTLFKKIGNVLSSKNVPMPQDRFLAEIIMLLALIAHIIDWTLTGLSIDSGAIQGRITIYFILLILTSILVGQLSHFFHAFFKFFKPAAVVLFIIPLLDYTVRLLGVSPEVTEIIAGFSLMLPIYALYLLYLSGIDYSLNGATRWDRFKDGILKPSGWVRGLTVLLFIIITFSLMSLMINLATLGSEQAGITGSGFDTRIAISGAIKIISTPFESVLNAIKGIGTQLNNTYTQLRNDSLGEYYTGQVEQNKELTGVFITELRTMGTYYEGQPVELFATLRMRSFVDEINLTTSCYAKDARGEFVAYGTTDPPKLINVYREDYRGVKCSFNSTNLPRGRYEVFFEVEFNFETWAYITISFMDRDFLSSLYLNDVDIQRRYNIQPRIRTIYTNGPIMLGLNDNLELPLAISTQTDQTNSIPLGITIDDRPPTGTARGELISVNTFQIRVPPQIQISKEKCIMPGGITGTELEKTKDKVTGYDIYSFKVSEELPGKYLTVSCNAEITATGARTLLNDPTGKRDITIAGSTTYDYKLTRREFIDVRNI